MKFIRNNVEIIALMTLDEKVIYWVKFSVQNMEYVVVIFFSLPYSFEQALLLKNVCQPQFIARFCLCLQRSELYNNVTFLSHWHTES